MIQTANTFIHYGRWVVLIKFALASMLVIIFAFRLWQTTGCLEFVNYSFKPISVKLNVESQISVDGELDRNIARIFHNKISVTFYEIGKTYSRNFGPKELAQILGPIGLVSVIVAIAYNVKKRNLKVISASVLVLISATLRILPFDSKLSFYIWALTLYLFAFFSVDFWAKNNIRKVLFLFLVFFSLWDFIFSWQMETICHEIFFN